MGSPKEAHILRISSWACVIIVLALVILKGGVAQDFLPFQTAANLAKSGQFDAIYPPHGFASLFSVDARFRETALAIAGEGYSAASVTAYVAPPPAILIGELLPGSPVAATMLWRTLIATTLVLSLLVLERDLLREAPGLAADWSFIVLGAIPLLLYVVVLGQASALLLVAATGMALLPSRIRDVAFGAALGVITAIKVFPAAMILASVLLGRCAAAAVALSVLCLSIVCFGGPSELWSDFTFASWELGTRVLADWNNASLDAGLAAIVEGGVSSTLVEPASWVSMFCLVVRALLLATVLWLVFRERGKGMQRRGGLLWVGLLAATPLLWSHYLICLLPAFQAELKSGRRIVPKLMVFGLSVGVVAKLAGFDPAIVSGLTVLGWLVTAVGLVALACHDLLRVEHERP